MNSNATKPVLRRRLMKIFQKFMTLAVVACLVGSAGCKPKTTVPSPPTQPSSQEHEHAAGETDHEVEGHSHGVGPHDGAVADWGGGKYHVEFTVDHDKQEATVYVLGSDEKTPTPIAAEQIQLSIADPLMQVALKSAPQQGDPDGTASRFIGNHESLGVVQEYAGTITGVIDDTPYSGDFAEEAHDH
jgi:hypothetical protein